MLTNGVAALADTVMIQGSGVNLALFKPESAGERVIVLPSRLIWEKGIQECVDAAKLLKAAGVAAQFALAGNTHPSNPRALPEEALRAWAKDGVVEWWCRREDMPQVMAACHIVCLPSIYGEGVPKVLLEAAAAGRPVVATDTAGCREVVDNGVEGLLVPAADAPALAHALRQLIQTPIERRAMGKAARTQAEDTFGIAGVVQTTLDVYSGLHSSPV